MRGKPELTKLKNSAGELKSPYWYIKYYAGRSRRTSTGYEIGTQDHEANLALAAFTLELERPTAREPASLMVAQALKDYYDEHAQYIATAKHAKYHEARLKTHFGNHFVSQITQAGVNAYVRKRQEANESNGTIRRDLEHLKASLNHEVREQRLIYAPKFKMPPAPPPRELTFTDNDLKRIKAACKSEHVINFITLMYETGQRPGAIEQLRWFQVDFKQQIIHFDKMAKVQTNKRVRPVPMSSVALSLLRKLNKIKQTEYVLEYFDHITKQVHKAGCVKKAFQRACEAAGVSGYRYALRKTFANFDMDDRIKADFMGHTNVKTTNTHYIKTNIPKMREALEVRKNRARDKKT